MSRRIAAIIFCALLPVQCLAGSLPELDSSIFSLFSFPSSSAYRESTGQIDSSFGGTGTATYDAGFNDVCTDLALLSDGSIVITGRSFNGTTNELIASRYSIDGILNTGFGTSGTFHYSPGTNTAGERIATVSSDNLIIAGYTVNGGMLDTVLLKIDSSGNFDTSFGASGISVVSFLGADDTPTGLSIDSSGRPVLSIGTGDQFFMAARLTSTGGLDTTFNGTGSVQTTVPSGQAEAYAIAVDSSARVIAGGYDFGISATYPSTSVRYSSTGALDTTFGGTGIVQTDVNATSVDAIYSMLVQSDGKVLTAGYAVSSAGDDELALIRYLDDGSLDTGFGSGGIVRINPTTGSDSLRSVILQPDGKIIAAGSANSSGANPDMVVIRLLSDGTLDASFGSSGILLIDVNGFADYAYRVFLQSSGAIIVGGTASNGANNDTVVLRLL